MHQISSDVKGDVPGTKRRQALLRAYFDNAIVIAALRQIAEMRRYDIKPDTEKVR
ncbi:MAG: hypothetical protein P1U82_26815 [Verrucomicrobiales bacterium]|jgi:hypothetical protein|nr:hypothetical protein [Verrucomicrobiales bacterium]